MAFGAFPGGYGVPGGSFGGPIAVARARDPRYAYAAALLNKGIDSSPVQSPWQGVARLGQAALGGYMHHSANEEYKGREQDYQKAIAEALKVGQGTPAVTRTTEDQSAYGGEGPQTQIVSPAVAGDPLRMAQMLAANQDAAPLGLQMQMQAIAAQQAAQAQAQAPYTLAPGAVRYGPNGQQIAAAPAIPEKPRTVNTAEGVFVLNTDGTLGQRLGGPSSLVTMNLPPSGYTPVDPNKPAAGMQPIPGGPADPATIREQAKARQEAQPPTPMTQDQANAALFADRMAASNAILAATEKQGLNAVAPLLGKLGPAGNYLQTEEYQKFDQAKRDFINATLRKESGATITPEEFANAEKQYFPQPGDSAAVMAQKAANRQAAIDGFVRTAGPQYKPKTGAPSVAAPKQTKTINGKTYIQDENGDWYQQ